MGFPYCQFSIPLSKMIIPNILLFLFEISNAYSSSNHSW